MDDSGHESRWEHSTTDFVQTLRATDTAGQGRAAWRCWVRALAESYGQGPDSPEREALEVITDLIDDRAEDALEFLRLRKSLLALFDKSWYLDRIRRIAPLVAGKTRFLEVSNKHLEGPISRTSFVSFVLDQAWLSELSTSILGLDRETLGRFVKAVERDDWSAVDRIVGEFNE